MTHHSPDSCPRCMRAAARREAALLDEERIRRELLDQLDAGGPELADAVTRWLIHNAAADVVDAVAEALNEEKS
jgi:hypothetical protein